MTHRSRTPRKHDPRERTVVNHPNHTRISDEADWHYSGLVDLIDGDTILVQVTLMLMIIEIADKCDDD
jgi:hypothetical protein